MNLDDKHMLAITIECGSGPASALTTATVRLPEVQEGQLLIRVRAAGINRPDIFQREGLYPPPPGASSTLGLEVAGEVVQGAGRFSAGDAVCALLPGGGYAQFAVCDAQHALPLPAGLSFEEAAALPETVFTVYANVFEDGALQPGETLLVHGATSGIGVAAIQMAKAHGARVIATARNADKCAAAKSFGADIVIDTSSEDFAAACQAAGGVDVVLDMVGGDYFPQNLAALNPRGRIVFIAALGGAEVRVPVFALMQKRAVLTGSTLRSRNADEKARLAAAVERVVWPWLAAGSVRVAIDTVFPLAAAAAAHERMESGQHVGKLVLHVD